LKRSRTDIVKSILWICKKNPGITTLLYESRLSYSQLRWYLDVIESNALIKTRSDNRFEITPKGQKYPNVVSELEKLVQFD
jgi:predicted transcriptional regulator